MANLIPIQDLKNILDFRLSEVDWAKAQVTSLLENFAKNYDYKFGSKAFEDDLEYLGLTKAKFYEFYGSPNFGPKTSKGNDAWGPVDGE